MFNPAQCAGLSLAPRTRGQPRVLPAGDAHVPADRGALVAAVDQLITGGANVTFSFVVELVLYFAALFFICMVCHGELARLKPSAKYLTSFYLMIAAGGALGGLFVSLVAPVLFSTYFEWKIGLIGGCGALVPCP